MNNAQLLIAGDFNLPSYDWENMTLKPKPRYPNLHRDFIDLLGDTGLVQVVKEPTRLGNTLDIVLTNCPSLIPRVEVIPGLSDHRVVYFEYITRPETRKNAARPILLFQRANWEDMKQDMRDLQAELKDSEDTPTEDLWQRFKSTLQDSMKKHIPSKTPRQKSSYPWFTYKIKKIVRRRDRLYRKWKKARNPQLDKEINSLNRKIQTEMRQSYWRYQEKLLTQHHSTSDPDHKPQSDSKPHCKNLFTYIKHQKSNNSSISALKSNGKLITDPRLKAEELNAQFFRSFSEGTAYSEAEFKAKCTMADSRTTTQPWTKSPSAPKALRNCFPTSTPTKPQGQMASHPMSLKNLPEK